MAKKIFFLAFFMVLVFRTYYVVGQKDQINGLSIVSPSYPFSQSKFDPVVSVNANWIALSPYAFTEDNDYNVYFNNKRQWWGERSEGIDSMIQMAQNMDLAIMIKPQIWMWNDWIGNFSLDTEEQWTIWEQQYTAYILEFAKIAEYYDVELFCIGTELKKVIPQRTEFWFTLIEKVKDVYCGPLTYAANWDHYQNIPFWSELDYIGIDAYFPLLPDKTPSVNNLNDAWEVTKAEIETFSKTQQRNVIFTEFGYMNCDYTAYRNWENEANEEVLPINPIAQCNAFESIFNTFWGEEWFAGGFIWKWYPEHSSIDTLDKHYSPQNKPAELIIQQHYAP